MNKYLILLILIIKLTLGQNQDEYCPECDENLTCQTTLTQDDCANGETLIPNAGICNCCPGCKGGINLEADERCDNIINTCRPGLACIKSRCALDKTNCLHTTFYSLDDYKWLPTCINDGTYAAKQCKGDRASGRCFCYSETGKRIFGWDWWRNEKEMTCACSRMRNRLEEQGKISTLHCKGNGNFEELQCDDDICWCANERTGEIINGTIAVPEHMWTMLPCYNSTLMGDSYLRQCESAAHAQKIMRRTLEIHGTTEMSIRNILCDYDGTYGTYIVDSGSAACTWRDGTRIGSFLSNANTATLMNCYCARDTKIFEANGLTLTLQCGGNGNYDSLQEQNGQSFCIDSDGFAVSDMLPLNPELDCSKYLYYLQ